MALTAVSVPAVADVPIAAGVPLMSGTSLVGGLEATGSVTLLSAAGSLIRSLGGQWGIFDSAGATQVLTGSVLGLDYTRDFRISDAPLEQGAFTSYNKVRTPFTARVLISCDGTGGTLSTFLKTLDMLVAALTLYSVVTPEITYPSVNVVHYDYRRETSRGVSKIDADVFLQEVRVTATQQYTSTATPAGQPNTTVGTVQTTSPTPTQATAIGGDALV